MWNSAIEFDLAAYHNVLKSVKRALRQLSEACLANLLLADECTEFAEDRALYEKRTKTAAENQNINGNNHAKETNSSGKEGNSAAESSATTQNLPPTNSPGVQKPLEMTAVLPDTILCCTTDKNNHLSVPALLPAFPLSRACL